MSNSDPKNKVSQSDVTAPSDEKAEPEESEYDMEGFFEYEEVAMEDLLKELAESLPEAGEEEPDPESSESEDGN